MSNFLKTKPWLLQDLPCCCMKLTRTVRGFPGTCWGGFTSSLKRSRTGFAAVSAEQKEERWACFIIWLTSLVLHTISRKCHFTLPPDMPIAISTLYNTPFHALKNPLWVQLPVEWHDRIFLPLLILVWFSQWLLARLSQDNRWSKPVVIVRNLHSQTKSLSIPLSHLGLLEMEKTRKPGR